MVKVTQDPDARLPHSVDWSAWLDPAELIVNSEWIVNPSAGVVLQEETVAAGVKATVWISGLTAGVPYTVTNRITTSSTPVPKIDDRSFIILCEDR